MVANGIAIGPAVAMFLTGLVVALDDPADGLRVSVMYVAPLIVGYVVLHLLYTNRRRFWRRIRWQQICIAAVTAVFTMSLSILATFIVMLASVR